MEDRYLFKAKRIDNGEWVQGYLVYDNRDKLYRIIMDIQYSTGTCITTDNAPRLDSSTICQCTGLKDKNGKLIWEKDIVDGHIKRGAAFLNCLVLWNESKARFDVRAKGCNFPMTLDEVAGDMSVCGLDYEVVGNKFDNPELLEA